LNPDESEERYAEVKYTVTKDGRTDNVTLVGSDAQESTQKSVVSALKKARYAPRLENGEPVDTPDVTWREKLLIKVKQQSAKTS
jgi:TonB family protein